MSPLLTGGVGFLILFALIMARMPIGLALSVVGLGGLGLLHDIDTVLFVLGAQPVETLSNHTLAALPLFLLMATVAVSSGLSKDLYKAAYVLVGHFRGGLAMATVVACGGFGAVNGSSLATVSAMARVSAPEMLRYQYAPELAAGSVAAGGTLGILIPPSFLLIVYAYLTEASVGKLFAAGVIPGIVSVVLYIGAIAAWTGFRPQTGPKGECSPWAVRVAALAKIWDVFLIFLVVVGGMFAGFFSPLEGGAVGACGAILIRFARRRLDMLGLVESLTEAMKFSVMIYFIVIGAAFFDYFLQAARVPEAFGLFVEGLNLSPAQIIAVIILSLLVLGCIMDAITIIFVTTPFLLPVVVGLGYDPIWFGIIMVMVVEIGLVTPPFGMNVFVVSRLVPDVSIWGAFRGVMPFIAADIVRLLMLLNFPILILLLPSLVSG